MDGVVYDVVEVGDLLVGESLALEAWSNEFSWLAAAAGVLTCR